MDSNASQMAILRRLECRDSSYIPKEFPLVFDRASGSEVWDVEGKKYIDLCAGFGTLALGHNPECFH